MSMKMIAVRDVDEDIFRKFRALSIEEKMKLGDALTLAMRHWIQEEHEKEVKPDKKNLLKIRLIKIGKKRVKWSEEVDEYLYGQ